MTPAEIAVAADRFAKLVAKHARTMTARAALSLAEREDALGATAYYELRLTGEVIADAPAPAAPPRLLPPRSRPRSPS